MKKADLKTGMVVEFKNGNRCLVLVGCLKTTLYGEQAVCFVSEDEFNICTVWNDDLVYIHEHDSELDIVKVYKPDIAGLTYMLDDCNEKTLIWERKPEVDWSKVPVDTKILIRESKNEKWMRRYFAKYENENVYAFNNGATSWSNSNSSSWKYAKLAEEE